MKSYPNHKPMVIELNAIYVSEILEQFYRVQVLQISKSRALCLFIDIGNKKWLNVDDVYEFNNVDLLLSIPAQAIRFSLKGLEMTHLSDISDHPDQMLKWMNVYLIGKHISAQIATTETNFQNTKTEHEHGIGTIIATFFDKNSFGMRRNLNDEILGKFCLSLRSPTLPIDEFVRFEITYLNNYGGIFGHNNDSKTGMKLLDKEMELIEQPMPVFNGPPTMEILKCHSGVQLVHTAMFSDDKPMLYRVKICQKQIGATVAAVNTLQNIKCNFIDYGCTEWIPYECFFKANLLLQKYPSQVIATELADIEHLTINKLKHIKSLLKFRDVVYVEIKEMYRKMITPQVRIYKLVPSANAFGSINDFVSKLDR